MLLNSAIKQEIIVNRNVLHFKLNFIFLLFNHNYVIVGIQQGNECITLITRKLQLQNIIMVTEQNYPILITKRG